MLAINYSHLRENLKRYCDQATLNHEVVVVTRRNKENVVLLSLDKYNDLDRAARNAAYLEKIYRGLADVAAGRYQEHDLIEE